MNQRAKFSDLVGQTITKIEGGKDSEELIFHFQDGRKMKMLHEQDCCECVTIEDICGDFVDIIGSPVLKAEETTSDKDPEGVKKETEYCYSFTWTFYHISTIKGTVTIRWYGESNGYYGETAECIWMKD